MMDMGAEGGRGSLTIWLSRTGSGNRSLEPLSHSDLREVW